MANYNPPAFVPGAAIRVPPNAVYPGFPNVPRYQRPQQFTMTPNGIGVHRNINANYVPNMIVNNPRFVNQMQMQMRMPAPTMYKQNGIGRLLTFVEYLGADINNLNLRDIQYWKNLTHNFFTEDVIMKYTLNDDVNGKTRRFEFKYQVIPRFYQTFIESGAVKIQLALGNPKERHISTENGVQFQVECPLSSIEYHFANGIQVTVPGRLVVTFNNNSLKMTSFDFVATKFTEYVPRNLLQRFTPETVVVNEYGIPNKTMRYLEIAEGVDNMQEVIALTLKDSQTGPLQALSMVRNQTSISDHPNLNQRIPNPQAQLNGKDIKNEPSNYNGAPPTPNTSDLQASAPTPTATPTPAPTPTQTPSPLVPNMSSIASPLQKNFSPALSNNELKRGIDTGPKKRKSNMTIKSSPRKNG